MHLRNQTGERQAGILSHKDRPFIRPLIEPTPDVLQTFADPKTAPRVYRREIVGYPGKMYGHTQVHCEVFATDEQMQKLSDTEKLVDQGKSSDRLPWGKLYFYIPAQTSFVDSPTRAVHGFISKDADSIKEEVEKVKVTESKTTVVKGKEVTKQVTKTESQPTGNYFDAKSLRSVFFPKQQAGVNDTALVVEMWYHQGSRFYRVLKEEKVGARKQYVPLLDGNQSFKMTDYEYDLYQRAKRMYPDSPSAGSDLMRFGRVIGVDAAAAGQADCWLAMPFGASKDQMGYIDLAQAKVLKYSDADFPHFKGWARLKESAAHAGDGTVDVQILSDLIAAADANKDGTTSPDELARYLKANPEMRRRLRYLICQAPSEWDDSYNAARYDSLQKPGKVFSNKPADYAEFKTFIQKFQFWGQAKTALAGHGVNSSTLWYFHPLQFVKQFRKANWLTLDEMVQLTPLVHLSREKATDIGVEVDTLYQPMRTRLVDGNNKGKSEKFRQWVPAAVWRNINWICVKYGIDTQQRKAHFWAQIMQETGVVQDVTENGDDDYLLGLGYAHKNGNKSDEDAVNFRGRGLIQITGREKYEEYSKFRRTKDYALVPNNELIATNAFETCDSAGWYYSYYRPRTCQAGDAGITASNVEAVTRAVNGGINHLPNRQTFFTHALCALGDQVGKFPAEYSPLNQDASDEFEKKKAEAALNATKKNKAKNEKNAFIFFCHSATRLNGKRLCGRQPPLCI